MSALDFPKLDALAVEQIRLLEDQKLTPAEMYGVAILMARGTQKTMRELLGEDAEIETASEAYLHVARLEQERG